MLSHAHLAPPGLRDELAAELARRGAATRWHGDLALVEGAPLDAAWAAETWRAVEELEIASIGDAARRLRERGRNWVHLSLEHHRRGELIAAKLPPFRPRALRFGEPVPPAPLGHFGLLAADRLLVLGEGGTGVPRGEFRFEEDRSGPPSRAYLKLWEAFTRLGARPAPGERCLDLGASPGGWTWALLQLGARVLAVDKAPLDPALLDHPRLQVLRASAFAPLAEQPELDPAWRAPAWLFSDVICYPERLLRLLETWLARSDPPRVIATVKFQGAVDPGVVDAFRALPGGRLLHLSANKHELSFARVGGSLAGSGASP